MYEGVTFESIMERMLDRIPNTMDKREGSVIYDALAPAAVEMQLMYIELDVILKETFADTASREYLTRRAAERGITPYQATYAVLKALARPITINIAIGTRFSLNELNYEVIEKVKDGEYRVQCETAGVVGNKYTGQMTSIDYVQGLESIEITEIVLLGEDEESTNDIRTRYFQTFDVQAYGGNKKDYISKTNALQGVGSTKVTPTWNGGGTVLLTILNSEYRKANEELLNYVQNEIDPTKDGTGIGIAPIGHVVTVRTADEFVLNITSSISFQDGYVFDDLKIQIQTAIELYLKELRKSWANETNTVIRISQIETRILNVQGVIDVDHTKINGIEANYELDAYAIPVLGGVING